MLLLYCSAETYNTWWPLKVLVVRHALHWLGQSEPFLKLINMQALIPSLLKKIFKIIIHKLVFFLKALIVGLDKWILSWTYFYRCSLQQMDFCFHKCEALNVLWVFLTFSLSLLSLWKSTLVWGFKYCFNSIENHDDILIYFVEKERASNFDKLQGTFIELFVFTNPVIQEDLNSFSNCISSLIW